MTSFKRFLPALFVACLASQAWAAEFTLAELMATLARVPAANDSFTETRRSALLSGPLILTGTLAYVRPDRLEKHVQAPYDERTVVSGNRVTVENRTLGQTKAFSLSSSATATAVVESLRATLAGDAVALERHFRVGIEGRREAWTMTLLPLDEKLAALVSRIRIAGAGERLARIEIEEAGGDGSTTVLGPARQ